MRCEISETLRYPYGTRAYSRVEGKDLATLKGELQQVFDDYPEYSDPEYGPACFDTMVKKFAEDDFYQLHFVAKRYLVLAEQVST